MENDKLDVNQFEPSKLGKSTVLQQQSLEKPSASFRTRVKNSRKKQENREELNRKRLIKDKSETEYLKRLARSTENKIVSEHCAESINKSIASIGEDFTLKKKINI